MSKLRSFQRHLKTPKVWLANQVAEEKLKIARQIVLDRAKKDAEFAADCLKAVGDNLPKEIKEACEASVTASKVTKVEIDESGLSQETLPEKCVQIDKEMGLDNKLPPPPGVLDDPLSPDAQKLVDEHLKKE